MNYTKHINVIVAQPKRGRPTGGFSTGTARGTALLGRVDSRTHCISTRYINIHTYTRIRAH